VHCTHERVAVTDANHCEWTTPTQHTSQMPETVACIEGTHTTGGPTHHRLGRHTTFTRAHLPSTIVGLHYNQTTGNTHTHILYISIGNAWARPEIACPHPQTDLRRHSIDGPATPT
jgi:hypothetical protein